MRSLLLLGTAVVLLATPANAFNIGAIVQVGSNNSAGVSTQLDPPAPIDKVWSGNVVAGFTDGNNNHNEIDQTAARWSTNDATALQFGDGNYQYTNQATSPGAGFYTPPVCVPFLGCIIPALPVPLHLNSNSAWTVQVGDDNYAVTFQRRGTGNGNVSGVLQVGWANGSAVFQVGGNNQRTTQIGFLNGSVTGQFGEDNVSRTLQLGVLNGAVVVQGGDDNFAWTRQVGALNGAATVQLGDDNTSRTRQTGVLNGALTVQAGDGHTARTRQDGSFNYSQTVQVGAGNGSRTYQDGNFNDAGVTQLGAGNEASITQFGTGNEAEVAQSSQGSWGAIGQVGSGNSATLVQGSW